MPSRKVTLQNIADMAGVSIATVSRVINQNGRYSKETEQRVKELIKKYNYRPNQMARSLRIQKGKVVGIIVPDITNEFFASMTLEIQMRLLDHDYITIICNTNESGDIEKTHLSMLKSQLVSGLVYITQASLEVGNLLDVPTIYIDRKPTTRKIESDCIFIESENLNGGYLAVKSLIDKNCKKIAIVGLGGEISSHINRFNGYKKALKENKIPIDNKLISFTKAVSYKDGYNVTKSLLVKNPNIDGIFYTADVLALGALQFLSEIKINVPEKIKIIGFDDISATAFSAPPLTTIHQSVDKIAELAIKKLMLMIKNKPIEIYDYQIPIKLITRGST